MRDAEYQGVQIVSGVLVVTAYVAMSERRIFENPAKKASQDFVAVDRKTRCLWAESIDLVVP